MSGSVNRSDSGSCRVFCVDMTTGMDVLTDLDEIIWTNCMCHDYHTCSNKCTRQGLTLNNSFNSFLAIGDFCRRKEFRPRSRPTHCRS